MNNKSVKFIPAAKLGYYLADLGMQHYATIVVISHFKPILLQGKCRNKTAISNNTRLRFMTGTWSAHNQVWLECSVSQFAIKTTVGFLKTVVRMSIKLYDGTRM